MSIIKWNEDLIIGIGNIDEQHRHLINIINELHLAVEYAEGAGAILRLLDELHRYAHQHFGAEEALLDRHDYPSKEDHAEEHRQFICRLDELKTGYQSSSEVLTVHVRDFLLSWFFNHIRTSDMEYKQYLEQKKVVLLR